MKNKKRIITLLNADIDRLQGLLSNAYDERQILEGELYDSKQLNGLQSEQILSLNGHIAELKGIING